jgi:hypothetical protein
MFVLFSHEKLVLQNGIFPYGLPTDVSKQGMTVMNCSEHCSEFSIRGGKFLRQLNEY